MEAESSLLFRESVFTEAEIKTLWRRVEKYRATQKSRDTFAIF